MGSGDLPVKVSREHAALWVTYICEAAEWDVWEEWDIHERASQILAFAMDEGLCNPCTETDARAAMTVVVTQLTLIDLCLQNDNADELYEFA